MSPEANFRAGVRRMNSPDLNFEIESSLSSLAWCAIRLRDSSPCK